MFLAAPAPRRRVFTLIELLVVVAIIAVLASILLPTLANARAKARETQCATNLKQLLMAYTLYLSESDERIPYNVASGLRPNAWDGVAQEVIPKAKNANYWTGWLSGSSWPHRYGIQQCPVARGRVRNLVGYDYNVNTTWDYTKGGSYCDGQVWSTIKAPEKYPYFYDGQVENRGDLGLGQGRWYSIYGSNQISFGPTAFKSVAPWHGSGNSGLVDSSPVTYSTTANFAFADGHTENIRIEKLIPGLVGGRWWDAFGRQL